MREHLFLLITKMTSRWQYEVRTETRGSDSSKSYVLRRWLWWKKSPEYV